MTIRFTRLPRLVYETSLLLYPPALRRRFGRDMADVFTLQLNDALARRSGVDAARVCFRAFAELLSVAMPNLVTNPALIVPVVSVLTTSVIYSSLSWALENPLRLNSIYHAAIHNVGGR